MIIGATGQSEIKPVISPKKKSVAILLNLILFGAFGLHRFYVGKVKSGGLLLVFSFLSAGSVGVVWGLYDLFTLLFTNKFTDADGLPLS
ncbi:MAG: TM2 domain-containing protein [Treponema sp.]|nr:TM2 domain-containing protein [Treponema sp.]